jgi:mRNA interferase HigB
MLVIGKQKIAGFIKKHARAKKPLTAWLQVIEGTPFMHVVNLREAFPSADFVTPYTIFNIAGNHFRLVAMVAYTAGVLTIEEIMTHEEYDRWNRRGH